MPKFIFLCRICGKIVKERGLKLQSVKENCQQGIFIGLEQEGFICKDCFPIYNSELLNVDRGTIVEE